MYFHVDDLLLKVSCFALNLQKHCLDDIYVTINKQIHITAL